MLYGLKNSGKVSYTREKEEKMTFCQAERIEIMQQQFHSLKIELK